MPDEPLVATERGRARVRKQSDHWFKHRLPAVLAQPDRVVFTDETSVKTNLTRRRGWSQRGERLVMDAPFGSWGTQTFIAGLSADRLIAPWVITGAMDGEAFAAYVEQVLVPELEPGTVFGSLTRTNGVRGLTPGNPCHAEEHGSRQSHARSWALVPVPAALSPDLTPIEMAFSKLKAHLRRFGARTFTDMFEALTEICHLFSSEECWNYVKAAGYVSG